MDTTKTSAANSHMGGSCTCGCPVYGSQKLTRETLDDTTEQEKGLTWSDPDGMLWFWAPERQAWGFENREGNWIEGVPMAQYGPYVAYL